MLKLTFWEDTMTRTENIQAVSQVPKCNDSDVDYYVIKRVLDSIFSTLPVVNINN
jgi:hypothetical protein